MPLAVREEAGVGDHERADGIRVVARPAQADQPAPVVHDERDALEAELGAEALDRLDVALPGPRRIGGRVAVAGEVGRDRAPAGLGDRRQHVAEEVGRVRVAVQQQRRRAVRRSGLAVRESRGALHAHGVRTIFRASCRS